VTNNCFVIISRFKNDLVLKMEIVFLKCNFASFVSHTQCSKLYTSRKLKSFILFTYKKRDVKIYYQNKYMQKFIDNILQIHTQKKKFFILVLKIYLYSFNMEILK